ncbi:MAG: CoB--CoM heterodisulfide reductase iron-sulfur subunit B family protein [Syntrophobacteraceae bacterium]|jgi:heterodisulfide reductase subunit B|nr:CoB--CoM heterodisulfide reductase iron-sulfur subunit B family protein [Syntrophobacteraceae bacterium]
MTTERRGADEKGAGSRPPKGRRVAYYPGCSLDGLASEYDLSTRAVCEALGIELVEIPDWSCCGSTPAHSFDPLLSGALAGRNLAIAEGMGLDVVMTPCPGCLCSLKGAIEVHEDREKRESFLHILGMPFQGRVRPISALQLLYEALEAGLFQDRVVKPLTDRVIAPYYGCLLTRPPAFARFDDPENPVSMDRLLEAVGATIPDFPYKTECCGATYGVTRNQIVAELTGRVLDMALRVGAQAVAVACPLCQQNLDLRQEQVNRHWKRSFDLPVVYLPQLLGLALGIGPDRLGLGKLMVSADFLLVPATPAEPAPSKEQEPGAP